MLNVAMGQGIEESPGFPLQQHFLNVSNIL